MFGFSAPSGGTAGGIGGSRPPLASPGGSGSGMMQGISSQPIGGQNPPPMKSYKEVKGAQQQPPKPDKDSAQLKQKLAEHEPIQTHSHYAKNDLRLIQDLFKVYSSYCTKYQKFVENIGGYSGPQMTY